MENNSILISLFKLQISPEKYECLPYIEEKMLFFFYFPGYQKTTNKKCYPITFDLTNTVSECSRCLKNSVKKPLVAYFAEQGIRHSIYLDDGRLISESKAQSEKDLALVY